MSDREVLMITTRPRFGGSLFRRFDGPPVHFLPDSAVTAEQWHDAALILVDAPAAPGVIARRLPYREGVIVVSDGNHSQALWRHATELRAGNVIIVPDGWPHLRAAVRDVGRGAAVVTVVSADDINAGAFVAAAVGLESCVLGQSCVVLDHDSGPDSVDSYVAEVEGELVGDPNGHLQVADPARSPLSDFQLSGAVRVSRVEHDLVVINLGRSDSALAPTALRLADVLVVVTTSGRVADGRSIAELCRSTNRRVRLLEVPADFDHSASLADDDFRARCWAALTVAVPTAPTA